MVCVGSCVVFYKVCVICKLGGHYVLTFVCFVHRGAAIDVKNKKGNSPLWLACNGECPYISMKPVMPSLV